MRWLITGGAGFVGRNLIARLLSGGSGDQEVAIFDDLSASGLDVLRRVGGCEGVIETPAGAPAWGPGRPPLTCTVGDVRDAAAVERACAGAEVVVHLAANTGVGPSVLDPRLDCEVNVIGTLNCLEAARRHGVGRFVFASSGAPAGLCEPPITERVVPRPASPYGASKLAGEAYCSAYAQAFGLSTVALRFSNVYGSHSGHKGSVVATFIRRALAGEPITINGDGRQTRDFVYVDDLVAAIELAARADMPGGEVFQIATGVETSVLELVGLLQPKLKAAGIPKLETIRGELLAADVPRSYADATKAREQLGWASETDLDRGLDRTVAWFAGALA